MDIPESGRERKGSVHFPDAQMNAEHSGEIAVDVQSGGKADVQLGFLQFGRRYSISLKLPQYLGKQISNAEVNPNVKMVRHHTVSKNHLDGHTLIIDFVTQNEGEVSEKLSLLGDESEKPFVLHFTARVLGRGKGTPMLKQGIHCVAIEMAETDVSDSTDVAISMHHQMPPNAP